MEPKEKIIINNSDIEILEPNYDGISKVINSFVNLYKVCENKNLIDRLLERLIIPSFVFKSKMFENGEINSL